MATIDIAETAQRRSANRRVAVVLASVTFVFFFGIIAARFMGGPTIGIGVMGGAVLLFLVVAIGRNLRASEGDAVPRSKGASAGDGVGRSPDAVDSSREPRG